MNPLAGLDRETAAVMTVLKCAVDQVDGLPRRDASALVDIILGAVIMVYQTAPSEGRERPKRIISRFS